MPSSVLNSDDGAISGTSGLKSTGGDDGVLKIQNNGVDAVTVADDGDVTLAADLSVTGDLLFNSGFGSAGTAYGCRAWVNFNGTGTVAIREDGNVSSITDNGTGDYTVNFTTAMPDSNYCVVCPSTTNGGSRGGTFYGPRTPSGDSSPDPQGSLTTSSVRVMSARGSSGTSSGDAVDSDGFYVAIFR